jgi:hypothetical protein
MTTQVLTFLPSAYPYWDYSKYRWYLVRNGSECGAEGPCLQPGSESVPLDPSGRKAVLLYKWFSTP